MVWGRFVGWFSGRRTIRLPAWGTLYRTVREMVGHPIMRLSNPHLKSRRGAPGFVVGQAVRAVTVGASWRVSLAPVDHRAGSMLGKTLSRSSISARRVSCSGEMAPVDSKACQMALISL